MEVLIMAGPNDPIRLTQEQFAKIPVIEERIRDYEFEVARLREAGLPSDEQRADIEKMKKQINGIKRVYAPKK